MSALTLIVLENRMDTVDRRTDAINIAATIPEMVKGGLLNKQGVP